MNKKLDEAIKILFENLNESNKDVLSLVAKGMQLAEKI